MGLQAPQRLGRVIGRKPNNARARARSRQILEAISRGRGSHATEISGRPTGLGTRVACNEPFEPKVPNFGLHIQTQHNVAGLQIPVYMLLFVDVR